MRAILIVWTIVGVLPQVFGQASQFVSQTHPLTQHNTSTSSTVAKDSDLAALHCVPLWGEKAKTSQQKKEDAAFLKACDQSFETRTEASRFFAERGWEYIAEGELDTACYRFNLAQLLDEKNSDAYWGLGVVCHQKGNTPEAIRMLSKGVSCDSGNSILLDDLATLYIGKFQQTNAAEDLSQAFDLLNRSAVVDAANGTTYMKLALAEYLRSDFDKSWEYLHKCRQVDVQVLDFNFIEQLVSQKPDPQGIFNKAKE